MRKKYEKVAKRLYALWKVFFSFFGIGSAIYMAYARVEHGIDIRDMPSGYHLIAVTVIVFVFLPYLLLIRKYALKSNSTKILTKINKQILILGICSAVVLFCNIMAIIVPEWF